MLKNTAKPESTLKIADYKNIYYIILNVRIQIPFMNVKKSPQKKACKNLEKLKNYSGKYFLY